MRLSDTTEKYDIITIYNMERYDDTTTDTGGTRFVDNNIIMTRVCEL